MPPEAERYAACENSLARLGTEWLDCYLLHCCGFVSAGEDDLAGFEWLQREGKIRSWA